MSGVMEIAGNRIEPGTRGRVRIPVTVGLNGSELALWVHAVQGRTSGPVLAVLSATHGSEWWSIPALRAFLDSLDPGALTGTILVVPVANPPALALNTRNIPDESDSPDLNRIFPGPLTWTSDQLIATISREVLARATALIDLHMGPWGSAFCDILVGRDFPKAGLSAETERLALAFGSPIVRVANVVSGFPGPRSSIGYAGGVLGIPAMGVELGGAGFGAAVEETWKARTIAGLRSVMGELGMLSGAADPRPPRQLIYSKSHRVNPRVGGFLRSRYAADGLGREVGAGELLGEVVSPYTFEVLEELRAPARGLLFYTARDYPVHPGDWAFGLADVEQGDVRWVERTARDRRAS